MYLIIDLEATCWQYPKEEKEIIEMGAVLIDRNYKILGEYQSFVRI